MSIRTLLRSASATAVAAAALVGAAAPAQAALVVASFDPEVGPALPNVGFRGSAEFFVADACLAQTGFIGNGDACSNNTMVVTSASVEFYDLADIDNVLTTLTYAGSSFVVSSAAIFLGEVAGINTSFSDPAPVLELNNFFGSVALAFSSGNFDGTPGGAQLRLCQIGGSCALSTLATSITYSTTPGTVPEPATLGLLGLAALGALGASRRRRADA